MAKAMSKLPSIIKGGDEGWVHGPDLLVDADSIIAVEPREHRWHSFRPAMCYCILHLATGVSLEVFATITTVNSLFKEAGQGGAPAAKE
jgi:hypothetical protein